MTDPYWRFPSVAPPERERESVPRSTFPGYASSEASFLSSNHLRSANDLRGGESDLLLRDLFPLRTGSYGFSDPPPSLRKLTAPSEEHSLISQRRDVALGVHLDTIEDKRHSLLKVDDFPADKSSMLFVDGLPKDCTRREVSHLFRPFIGFKDIKVVHRGARKPGDKAMVLCFVEFSDAKCALTAMDALQGYRFDVKMPESPALKIQFAQFPFNLPSAPHDDQRHELLNDRKRESHDDRRHELLKDRRHESHDDRRHESHDDRRHESHNDRRAKSNDARRAESRNDRRHESHDDRRVESHDKRRAESRDDRRVRR